MGAGLHIYWFKRDLRLSDLEGLQAFQTLDNPVLLVYLHEPSIWRNAHYSQRHLNFVKQSLEDMNASLARYNAQVMAVTEDAIPFFEKLHRHHGIGRIHSTEESGLDHTYTRDKQVKKWCKTHKVIWQEFQNNGVVRGAKNRSTWSQDWYEYMCKPLCNVALGNFAFAKADSFLNLFTPLDLTVSSQRFQQGGERQAHQWLDSFFLQRSRFYAAHISKPLLSRMSCSRLSPYIAWGNVSIRQVFQRTENERVKTPYKKSLSAFSSRLRWQSHFIQKFEQEPRIEFEAINRGYQSLKYPYNADYVKAWKEGKTGYPLVDAAMRAVRETGYINFRMRALVVSFLCHHLFQHFTTGSAYLAACFLDWEPGIHYGQFQMQAGLTGTNTLRIYNPVKGAQDHDPDALFIKQYIPELRPLSARFAREPWLLEQELNEYHDFNYGIDYPRPIVDIAVTRKHAADVIYSYRNNPKVQWEALRILSAHSMINRMA